MILGYDEDRGAYFDGAARGPAAGGLDYYWTAFCGEYGEEIDVLAWSEAEARAVVLAAIERDYEPIEIRQIERRYGGLIYI